MDNNTELAIEDKFSQSWDQMEDFYVDFVAHYPSWQWLKPMLGLIAALRQQGYDRQFRAGQSLHMLVLSRSREHGLRPDQPSLAFESFPNGSLTLHYRERQGTRTSLSLESMELTPEADQLLLRLLEHPID